MVKKYITKQVLVNTSGPLRAQGANAITILNTGTSNVRLDSFILIPGATYTDNGWPGEEIHNNFNVEFVGGSGELLLFIKQYI